MSRLEIDKFLDLRPAALVIDVRAPVEFHHGHIPGALNLPLLNNEERAAVGTCHRQHGPEQARMLALRLVGPHLHDKVKTARKLNPERKKLLLYCWRGGARSKSMAWLLENMGMELAVLEGGYRSYRQHAREVLAQEQNMAILGGYTGSGKTLVLQELRRRGEQVIDLEGLAHHKGSAFGSLNQPPQPSNEHFENLFFEEWRVLERQRRVWLEDESHNIGSIHLPAELWKAMRAAPVYYLDIPQAARQSFLLEDYRHCEPDQVRDALDRIRNRLGGLHHGQCLQALNQGDYSEVIRITLNYYDKAYLHGLSRRDPGTVTRIACSQVDASLNADQLSKHMC